MISDNDLNSAQKQAAAIIDGPALVIAGAGTGKTRTLVYRLATWVNSGIHPRAILLLTFTRRAAREMIQRASELLGGRSQQISGGTFHSFANSMLMRYSHLLGFKRDFTVIDQSDILEIFGSIRDILEVSTRGRKFPRRETIAAMVSKAINKQRDLSEIVATEYEQFLHELPTIIEIQQRYIEYKLERCLVDFDDLLLKLIELLENNSSVREEICRFHPYLMVDEYQDTNILQAKITVLLAGPSQNIMVVGDEAQSIYAFRGACFQNLFSFKEKFTNVQLIKLEENYRSTQPILNLSNQLLKQMSRTFRKSLYTSSSGGEKPYLVAVKDEQEQARFVSRTVDNLVRNGTPVSDIAILFRASFHSYQVELELNKASVAFTKYGGLRFTESSHLKDVISHLRMLHNRDDELSFKRVIMLCQGIGQITFQKIYRHVSSGNIVERLRSYPTKGAIKDGIANLIVLLTKLENPKLSPKDALNLMNKD